MEWRQGVAGCGNADDGFIGAAALSRASLAVALFMAMMAMLL